MPAAKIQERRKEDFDLGETGHHVVLGTAGSGKSTMAISRTTYLSKLDNLDGHRVLLVTFNKALVIYLNYMSQNFPGNVDILNYHKFACEYLTYRGMLGKDDIVPNGKYKLKLVSEALREVSCEVGHSSTLQRAREVFYEEINWIQRMGITTLNEYIYAERVGRGGTRIIRDKRGYFFMVYEKYLKIRRMRGYLYDWDDLAYFVNEEFEEDDTERLYKHIIIDEGQDFSPVMLKSLVNAVSKDGSLTFFGDVAQQIYGGRISWRNAGMKVKPDSIRRFEQNYRNTREIAELAVAISKLPFFKYNADIIMPKVAEASGPLPSLLEFRDEDEEMRWVLKSAGAMARNQAVAVLVRDRHTVENIKLMLDIRGTAYQELYGGMDRWNHGPGISVGTYHSSKGLEFDAVIIPFCSSSRLPEEETVISLEDRNEALSEESKLIYVAVTRARRNLVITYTRELTEMIPASCALYTKMVV